MPPPLQDSTDEDLVMIAFPCKLPTGPFLLFQEYLALTIENRFDSKSPEWVDLVDLINGNKII